MNMESKNIGLCPDCGEEVRFKKFPFVGQLVTCRRCTTQLEVRRKSPIELRLAAAAWGEGDEEDFALPRKPRNKRDNR
ncbi:MAG: hypothetical protein DHS20C20_09610 [Ardenticatenaceae bacterium]|nr:MAG: hypothetical protein DHS20C20_09610 [Ardenticatenaceae bacterium]